MKLSRSRVRCTIVAVLALLLLFGPVASAMAELGGGWSGTSETNPNAGTAEWREDWGNKLVLEQTFSSIPQDPDSKTLGFLYTFTRNAPAPVPLEAYKESISWDPTGMMLGHTFDLYALERDKNASLQPTDLEGMWYMNLRFFNASRVSTITNPAAVFGIDLTKPAPVEGFTSGVTLPTQSPRRTFTWTHKEYDTLSPRANSGTAWYHVFLNGTELKGWDGPKDFDDHGTFYFPSFPPPWLPVPSITIEDLPPGINKVGIQVEDRATNLSDMVVRTEIVDPDYPTAEIRYPDEGECLNGVRSFEASAADDACYPTVAFKIDGVTKATLSKWYMLDVDTRNLKDGKHTFTIEAKDLFGHVRTASRTFYVDNSPMKITSLSDSPDPFYPVIQDKIRDTTTFRAYLSERATDAYLQVLEAGAIVRQMHATNVSAGWTSFTWDGTNGGGTLLAPGGFPGYRIFQYRVITRDGGGNWSFSPVGQTEIRNFEVVPISSGTVKVVQR